MYISRLVDLRVFRLVIDRLSHSFPRFVGNVKCNAHWEVRGKAPDDIPPDEIITAY